MRIRIRRRLAAMASMTALVVSLMIQWPATAMASQAPSLQPLAAFSNKVSAKAKQDKGRLESAIGELTGDTGRQIQGKTKQTQASAMKATEAVKDGTRTMARKASEASGKVAENIK